MWNKDKRDIKHQWRAGSRATHFVSHTEKEKWAAANRNSRRVGVGSKRLGFTARRGWLGCFQGATGVSGTRTDPLSLPASSEEGSEAR